MRPRKIASSIAVLAIMASGPAKAAMGILDEAKLGILDHDVTIGAHHEEPGVDANAELLFVSPALLASIWAPRPHIGVTVNSAGRNSYAYAGLTWTANFTDAIFGDFGAGGAIHDGPNRTAMATRDHKGLGTRFLFHESVELGYRLSHTWNVAAFLDHVSNADLGRRNPGITNIGLRLGYAF
jgi:lipid A 3-O-deacylase